MCVCVCVCVCVCERERERERERETERERERERERKEANLSACQPLISAMPSHRMCDWPSRVTAEYKTNRSRLSITLVFHTTSRCPAVRG